MIRGQSTMGLAGPVLVKAGTGEEIDKESLGGASVQADKNGLADLAVDSEAEVFEAIRKFLSYLPSNCREPLPISETGGAVRRGCRGPLGYRAIEFAEAL